MWTAATTAEGYAAFNYYKPDGVPVRDSAHTWAYRNYIGPVPPRHQVDHLCHTVDLEYCDAGNDCRHRACVNYERHLEATTPAENTMRSRSWAASKKRQVTCKREHLLVAPNLSTTPSDLARNTRRCMACTQTHRLLNTHRRAGHPDSEFNFQATSDLIYNRIIPEQDRTEQRTSINQEQLPTVTI